MAKQKSITETQAPLERIQDHARIVAVQAAQLEATARALTHVSARTEEGQQAIEPEDLPRIMHLFAQQLESIVDVAGDIEATAEFAMSGSLKVIKG